MKKIIIGAVVVVILAIGAYAYFQKQSNNNNPVSVPGNGPGVEVGSAPIPGIADGSVPGKPTQTDTYTLSEVAAHATKSDCYTAIRGSVYNLTSWISQHPGGAKAIEGLCGKDGTDAFVKQHGGKSKPEETLAGFKVGKMVQ